MPIWIVNPPRSDQLDDLPEIIVRRATRHTLTKHQRGFLDAYCSCPYIAPPDNPYIHFPGCGFRLAVLRECAFFASGLARRNPLAKITRQ